MSTTAVTDFCLETRDDGAVRLTVDVMRVPAPFRGPMVPDVADLPADFVDALRRWVDGAA